MSFVQISTQTPRMLCKFTDRTWKVLYTKQSTPEQSHVELEDCQIMQSLGERDFAWILGLLLTIQMSVNVWGKP